MNRMTRRTMPLLRAGLCTVLMSAGLAQNSRAVPASRDSLGGQPDGIAMAAQYETMGSPSDPASPPDLAGPWQLKPNAAVGGGTSGNMAAVTAVIQGTGLFVGTEWHTWTDTQRQAAINNAAKWGFAFISPKIASEAGSTWYTDGTQLDKWIGWCTAVGIKFFPYSYVNPSTGGTTTGGTATTTNNRAAAIAADIASHCGIVLVDMESEWNSTTHAYDANMTAFMSEYRRLMPNTPMVVSGFGDPGLASGNNGWPYAQAKTYIDAYSPQWYYGVWSPYLNNKTPQGAVDSVGWGESYCTTPYGANWPYLPSFSIYTTGTPGVMPVANINAAETRGRDWKAPIIWWEYGNMDIPTASACVGYGFFSTKSLKPSASYPQTPANLPAVAPLAFSPATIVGGNDVTATVTLNGPAPPAGVSIALSSNSTAATVPASVLVTKGNTSATFTIHTATVQATAHPAITATDTISGTTQTTSLSMTVTPQVGPSLAIAPGTIGSNGTATATLTLDTAAPSPDGATATLSSDNAAVTVPDTVTVGAGMTTATFPVSAGSVAVSTVATITATVGGKTTTAHVEVTPLSLGTLTIAPGSVTSGGQSTATLTINGSAPAPDGLEVTLASDTATVTVAPTVTVPAGQSSVTFPVSSVAVAATATAHVTATLGTDSASAPLTITPLTLTQFYLTPAAVDGGVAAVGTVVLNVAAPWPDGVSVALSSDNPVVKVPASGAVVVPAGQTSADFPIATTPVAILATANVTASLNSGARTTPMQVQPVAGDLDLSGAFDLNDVVLSMQISAGIATATPDQMSLGDLNSDGILDVSDAATLLRQLEGL